MAVLNQAAYNPGLSQTDKTTQTWTPQGNTFTVTNNHIKSTSIIVIHHTSAHSGNWYISAIADASFTITSTNAENGATFKYVIL